MQRIKLTSAGSICDFDHGEGCVTFSWVTTDGLDALLTIDLDGHCSREMPVRSGTEPEIVAVESDRIQLRFRPELADKLQLETDVEMICDFDDATLADLRRLWEYY